MKSSINNVLFFLITLFTWHAQAESSAELSCKAQAKEVAVQTYSGCITEARNNQIEQIRKSYKEDLSALKSKYDHELKKMTGKATKRGKGAPTVQEVSAAKPTHGIAHKLPTKSQNSEAIPVQTMIDSPTVVPVENNTSSLEKEATDADNGNIEIINMPTVDEAPAT